MANAVAAKAVEVTLNAERETKNTVRFAEQGDPEDHAVGTIYVPKATLDRIGNPTSIRVSIEPAS
jgi:hypothetical protein